MRTLGAAAGAIDRLGDAAVPAMAERLEAEGLPAPQSLLRLVRAVTTRTAARDEVLVRHIGHPDRELGLVVLECLVAPDPAPEAAAADLDGELADDVRHGTRILAALAAFDAAAGDVRDSDGPARRALGDELDLVRQRVVAGRLARHGSGRLGPAMVELGAGGSAGALAVEALGVLLGPAEAAQVIPLAHRGMPVAERMRRLSATDRRRSGRRHRMAA